jgi:hypothetical protein
VERVAGGVEDDRLRHRVLNGELQPDGAGRREVEATRSGLA